MGNTQIIGKDKFQLLKKLSQISIKPENVYARKIADSSQYTKLIESVPKGLNNCYCNHNDITAVILDNQMFIFPTGLIKEYDFITSGLELKDFEVPMSVGIYIFKDDSTQEMLNFLVDFRDKLRSL